MRGVGLTAPEGGNSGRLAAHLAGLGVVPAPLEHRGPGLFSFHSLTESVLGSHLCLLVGEVEAEIKQFHQHSHNAG